MDQKGPLLDRKARLSARQSLLKEPPLISGFMLIQLLLCDQLMNFLTKSVEFKFLKLLTLQ